MREEVSLKATYNKLTREIRNGLNKCRSEWIERQCLELETAYMQNDIRKLFGKVKDISGGETQKVRNNIIKVETGRLLTNENDVKERWYQYANELYNQSVLVDDFTQMAEEEPGILEVEVRSAIKKL